MSKIDFSRQELLIGEGGQERLAGALVWVVGAGGLGCPVLEYLAGSGVGNFCIFDPDQVSVTNLHRQLLYRAGDLGQKKAEVAAIRVREIFPDARVQAINQAIDAAVLDSILMVGRPDVVVDGTDNFGAKYLLNDFCRAHKIPLVYGSVLRWEGQAAVFHARAGADYRLLFPEPDLTLPDCASAGVMPSVAGLVGMVQAKAVLDLLLSEAPATAGLDGRLWSVSAGIGKFEQKIFWLPLMTGKETFESYRTARYPDLSCRYGVEADWEDLLKTGGLVVDVREDTERILEPFPDLGVPLKLVHLPLSRGLEEVLEELRELESGWIVCAHGIRSLQVALAAGPGWTSVRGGIAGFK